MLVESGAHTIELSIRNGHKRRVILRTEALFQRLQRHHRQTVEALNFFEAFLNGEPGHRQVGVVREVFAGELSRLAVPDDNEFLLHSDLFSPNE